MKRISIISVLSVLVLSCLFITANADTRAILIGDANNDGVVDVSDITTIASYILSPSPTGSTLHLDANCDGIVDIADITSTSSVILGKPERHDMTFSASPEGSATRTTLDESKYVFWANGDAIGVYEGAVTAQKFTLSSGGGTKTGHFTGRAQSTNGYYALYPYQENAKLSYETYIINNVTLPSVQKVKANTFDPKTAIMVGSADNLSFSFQNVFACIKIPLDATMAANGVKSISFMGNSNEKLAGTFNVKVADQSVSWSGSDYSSMVSIVPENGGTFDAGTYYITVLPTTITAKKNAFTIMFATNNGIMYKTYNTVKADGTTPNELVIGRNKIITIATTSPKTVDEWVDMGEDVGGKNVLWRSWNLGANHPYESGDYYSWAETEVKYTGFGTELHESNPGSASTSYYYDINLKTSMSSASKYYTNTIDETGYTSRNTPYFNNASGIGAVTYSKYNSTDGKTTLEQVDDVAYQQLHELHPTAQIPTKGNIEYLINGTNCSWSEVKDFLGMGVRGYIVMSKESSTLGNWIFIPFDGLCQDKGKYLHTNKQTAYWSNTLSTDNRNFAYNLYLNTDSYDKSQYSCNSNGRYMGLLVRPVKY